MKRRVAVAAVVAAVVAGGLAWRHVRSLDPARTTATAVPGATPAHDTPPERER